MRMPSWGELLPEWSFRDQRLRRRALLLLDALLACPGQAFGAVFGKAHTNTKQAYDFCENIAVSLPSLLAPAFFTTGNAVRESLGTVLVIQDTTELDLSTRKAMQGIGEIGNPKCRGIFLHAGIAVAPDGLPFGLLSTLTWVRDPAEHGKAVHRDTRTFEEKESFKWWKTIERAERVVNCPGRLVHIGDREIDVFDVFARCLASGYRGLFRAAQNRSLLDARHTLLWAEAESWPVAGQKAVEIPARPAHDGVPARAARTAQLALRFGSVKIAQSDGRKGVVPMSVVFVREVDPPSSTDCIEWLLLSTDPLDTAEDAWTRVDWYRRRWLIEEFHKCLKTTCHIEERQFRKRTHFETYLALVMLVSIRLLFLRTLARVEPDTPVQEILSADEEVVLRAAHDESAKTPLPAHLTAYRALRFIAMLGGFLARSGDGEPGFQTLTKGYAKLTTLVQGYRLARGLRGPSNPLRTEMDRSPAALFCHWSAHTSPP